MLREDLVRFRLTPAERRLLERAAQLAGESLSQFIRTTTFRRATMMMIEVHPPAEPVASEADQ